MAILILIKTSVILVGGIEKSVMEPIYKPKRLNDAKRGASDVLRYSPSVLPLEKLLSLCCFVLPSLSGIFLYMYRQR